MRAFITVLILAVTLLSTTHNLSAQHYFNGEKQIPLTIDPGKILIRFDSTLSESQKLELAANLDRLDQKLVDELVFDQFEAYSLTSSDNYATLLDSLYYLPGIEMVEPYYLAQEGQPFPISSRYYAVFGQDVTRKTIDSLNSHYHVLLVEEHQFMKNVFLLRNTRASGMRTLELANLYHSSKFISQSHPSFGAKPVANSDSYTLYDYYHQYQPHLKKVIGTFNDRSVWDFANITNSIIVAVFDYGIESHEDLPATRILPGHDFAEGDTDPSPDTASDYAHGMGVTGFIAASHTTDSTESGNDSTGVISMNPNVFIRPIKIFGIHAGEDYDWKISNAILWADAMAADIMQNSWNYFPHIEAPLTVSAYAQVDTAGRTGLGSVVVFSSNNGFSSDCIWMPANLPTTFAVGAIDLDDVRRSYSCYGPSLDMVAPVGSYWNSDDPGWTIDQEGSAGLNNSYHSYTDVECPPGENDTDYFCSFNGTSAAAPLVSGTASLILSFDYNLTNDEVYDILRNSAVTELESGTITPPDTAYGYGRVDAFRAILSLARGDMNATGTINLADITLLIDYVYQNGPEGFPDERLGNCNCSMDGKINLADINLLIDHVYLSHAPLPLPCFDYEYPNQQ